jgi:hypothetical protein
VVCLPVGYLALLEHQGGLEGLQLALEPLVSSEVWSSDG